MQNSHAIDPELIIPPLSSKSKILSFDIESNGLHGPAFAVAGVLMQADGTVVDEFKGRAPIRGEVDEWVAANVLPVLGELPVNYPNAKAMRQGFWSWYLAAKEAADFVLVSNGYPVEMRFLIACQDDDIKERYWQHPFPLVELNSLLMAVGVNSRHKLIADKLEGKQDMIHNPYWDAWVSGLSAVKALTLLGRIKA